MARRKSRKVKPTPSKNMVVSKSEAKFQCPFCNHPGSVECFFDGKHFIAEALCYVCGEKYCTKFSNLTDPIDVYSEWIDECEKANQFLNAGSTSSNC